jgi:cytochrome bd-type quinol oxidase subunit 1
MVAFGATLSAFWIIVANSRQQTPTGFVLKIQKQAKYYHLKLLKL